MENDKMKENGETREEGERKKSSHLVRRGKMEWRERMRSTSCWAWEEERMD